MAPVIVAKDLYKCYPGFPPVLRGASIEVRPGEMVAIMGPSGCGKSTMLHILGMLHAPDSGELEILGENVLKLDSEQTAAFRRGNMGFVMQASNLFEHSTVFENVEFPLIYENVPPQERWERVIRALELVRLSSRVHYRSNRLSGGEQQRVAIARAMVNNPRVLLADEPTGALDARTSSVIMENFRSLCHKGGVAMVMVTHDPKMAEYCDSIYTLEEGSLHCKKHDPPEVSATSSASFLREPDPIVRGALAAWSFPDQDNHNILEYARHLHGDGLLSRIYALTRNGLFAGAGDYSLPLAVRHIGFWQRLFGVRVIFQKSASIRAIMSQLPPKPELARRFWRLRAFSCGAILAKWCKTDNIQFLYACGARKVAASAWVAARISDLPFAFAIRPEDLPLLGKDCLVRARDAAFITCATPAIAAAFQRFAPKVPKEKILVIPDPPRYVSGEAEIEAGLPPQPDKPADILTLSPQSDRRSFAMLMQAAQMLKKKGLKFRVTALGRANIGLRMRLVMSRLRRQIVFTGKAEDDRLGENFRSADMFIAWAPNAPGMELAMPWPVCEAMSFGLPLVVTGISPGMAPLQPGVNCLQVSGPEDMAEKMEEILKTPNLAQKIGEKAKTDIRAFLNLAANKRIITDRIAQAAGLAEYYKDEGAQDEHGL